MGAEKRVRRPKVPDCFSPRIRQESLTERAIESTPRTSVRKKIPSCFNDTANMSGIAGSMTLCLLPGTSTSIPLYHSGLLRDALQAKKAAGDTLSDQSPENGQLIGTQITITPLLVQVLHIQSPFCWFDLNDYSCKQGVLFVGVLIAELYCLGSTLGPPDFLKTRKSLYSNARLW